MAASDLPHDTALEHLRIIRTLMERASIYRAVSATAALCGGVIGLAVAAWGMMRPPSPQVFLAAWIGVLCVSGLANLFLLMRESQEKGQPFITDGLRMALRAVVPPLLTGGVLGVSLIAFRQQMELAALIWILCYGLALQGTVSFAPRSIIHLARAFLIAGQVLTVLWLWKGWPGMVSPPVALASLYMGLTFGLFHIIYGVAVFLSQPRELVASSRPH
jgi:hypothetical protein